MKDRWWVLVTLWIVVAMLNYALEQFDRSQVALLWAIAFMLIGREASR